MDSFLGVNFRSKCLSKSDEMILFGPNSSLGISLAVVVLIRAGNNGSPISASTFLVGDVGKARRLRLTAA